MFTLKHKPLSMPSVHQALPGRPQAMPTAKTHFVNSAALKGPYPQGAEMALFGLGCFWGAERKFCSCRVSSSRRSAMPEDSRRTQPMRRCAPA